jgi:hypothetical protein
VQGRNWAVAMLGNVKSWGNDWERGAILGTSAVGGGREKAGKAPAAGRREEKLVAASISTRGVEGEKKALIDSLGQDSADALAISDELWLTRKRRAALARKLAKQNRSKGSRPGWRVGGEAEGGR